MRNSAVQAVHSAFGKVRELGFAEAQLENYAIEWWVGKQEIQYEGASLGLAVALATVAALTGQQVDPRIAVTGAVDRGQVVAVTGVCSKWESLRSLGTFSRLIVAPGNLSDLPPDAWREPELKISAVPTLEAAVAEVFGRIECSGELPPSVVTTR
jgi:predicted ATP-dependent protease